MQKWEYKWHVRSREEKRPGEGMGQWDTDMVALLPGLGDDGWELVAVVPRSSWPGAQTAGVTDEELWVFKRPKQE